MKRYYYDRMFVYSTVETVNASGVHDFSTRADGNMISFRADVWLLAPSGGQLCGTKLKDNVLVIIPITTSSMVMG
jgi:hypothetical protein